jgi:hypothetical protein
MKNTSLRPPTDAGKALIAPPAGKETLSAVPFGGTIKAIFDDRSVPPYGHHLDMPSPLLIHKNVLELE